MPYTHVMKADKEPPWKGRVDSLKIVTQQLLKLLIRYVFKREKRDGVSFKVNEPANALTVRYTVPDGASGQLDVQVNGHDVQQLRSFVSSNWQSRMTKDCTRSAQADTCCQFDEIAQPTSGSLEKERRSNISL